jgi:DNA-binding CsgD family transcriptional regulator
MRGQENGFARVSEVASAEPPRLSASRDERHAERVAALVARVRESHLSVALFDLVSVRIVAVSASARVHMGLQTVDLDEFDFIARSMDPAGVGRLVSLIAEQNLTEWHWRSVLHLPDGSRRYGYARGRRVAGVGDRILSLVRYDLDLREEDGGASDAESLLDADHGLGGDERRLSEQLARLRQHVARIAREVEATGVVTFAAAPEPSAVPGLHDLSAKQWEVLTRLLRGERVATIARAMYLSPSTVRNHLTTIYRKVGVGSQAELLELLHRAQQRHDTR